MNNIARNKQRGFSLIELMIALVLGLFIIGGVLSVFIGSSQTFNANEALSRVQENGRFAIELIAEDIRNSGYTGRCFLGVNNVIDIAPDGGANDEKYNLNNPIKGWAVDTGEFFSADLVGYKAPVVNEPSDIIIVKHAARSSDLVLTRNIEQDEATFPSTGTVARGDIVLLSDAAGCDLFQHTGADDADLARGTVGSDINNQTVAAQLLSHAYTPLKTDILFLTSRLFYIGQSASASNALRSITYDGRTPISADDSEELVEGISTLSFRYGVVSGAAGVVDYSQTAAQIEAADVWDDVVAVRIFLTAQGEENISRNFSTTVALRNRLR